MGAKASQLPLSLLVSSNVGLEHTQGTSSVGSSFGFF